LIAKEKFNRELLKAHSKVAEAWTISILTFKDRHRSNPIPKIDKVIEELKVH
jgi:hypothetical protein